MSIINGVMDKKDILGKYSSLIKFLRYYFAYLMLIVQNLLLSYFFTHTIVLFSDFPARLSSKFSPLSEPVSFSRPSRFVRVERISFVTIHARAFFFCGDADFSTRHKQPPEHMCAHKRTETGRRRGRKERTREDRTYFREKGFRGNVGRASKSWISWRGGDRSRVFEDDHQRGGRVEGDGGIMSMERGMKRSSQIFLDGFGEKRNLSGRVKGACERDELLRRDETTDFDSLGESYGEKGLSSNTLKKDWKTHSVE